MDNILHMSWLGQIPTKCNLVTYTTMILSLRKSLYKRGLLKAVTYDGCFYCVRTLNQKKNAKAYF